MFEKKSLFSVAIVSVLVIAFSIQVDFEYAIFKRPKLFEKKMTHLAQTFQISLIYASIGCL